MSKLSENILRRYECAKNNREQWRSYFDVCYQYLIPNRNYWDSERDSREPEGRRKNERVYDITAPLSARSLNGKLFSTLTPPFRRWAEYAPGSVIPDTKKDDVKEFLQAENEKLFNHINRSNFPIAVTEFFYDFMIGTAALVIDEGDDDNPLIFSCEPICNLGFEEDSTGIVNSIYRDHKDIYYRDIINKWPNATIPEEMQREYEKDSETKFTLMDAFIYDEEKKEYTYYVTWMPDHEVIYEEKTTSQKFIVSRWSKLPGEIYGRGVGMDVLPTVLTLNEMYKLMLEASELGAFPPFLSFTDGVFNPDNIRLSPKTIIPVKGIGDIAGSPLKPLEMNPNLQLSEMSMNDLRQWIQKAFYTDPLGPVDAPKKTATEVSIRQQEFLEEIGAAFGRLEIEFLSRIIERCTYILRKKGILDKDLIINGKNVTLEYQSPLAQLQNQTDLQNFSLADQVMGAVLGQFKIAAYKLEELPKWIADKAASDESIYKSRAELQRLAADIKQNMMAQLGDQPQQELPQAQPLGAQSQLLPTQPGQ